MNIKKLKNRLKGQKNTIFFLLTELNESNLASIGDRTGEIVMRGVL